MDTVFAIDPGTTVSSYVIWDGSRLLDVGKDIPNDTMLRIIGTRGGPLKMQPVIEMVASYGMSVGAEVFETCVWIGRFQQAFEVQGTPAWRVPRRFVKMHLCQSMRAKDGNISQALKDRFGLPGTKKAPGLLYGLCGDSWQAFALAVTASDFPVVLALFLNCPVINQLK